MITIVDYNVGNLGSIVNMFKRIGQSVQVTGEPAEIRKATKLLLPGVGAFDKAMSSLNKSGLRGALETRVLEDRIPILGICLGMQLLTNSSEEGTEKGLGWIEAETRKFPRMNDIKIPHMGWNTVMQKNDSPLAKNLAENARFYFVHSYYVDTSNQQHIIFNSHHGIDFNAVINDKNIYGAQFHPEKSHQFGMQLLRNFGELVC